MSGVFSPAPLPQASVAASPAPEPGPASPCTGVCRIHQPSGWCEGCARSIPEITVWSRADASVKRQILEQLPARREQLAELGIFISPPESATGP